MTETFQEALSVDDILLMQERLIAEVARRIGSPAEAKKLTGRELTTLASAIQKITDRRAAAPAAQTGFARGSDLDLVSLIERLPPEQARKELQNERQHLKRELEAVEEALNRSDKWKESIRNARKWKAKKAKHAAAATVAAAVVSQDHQDEAFVA